MSVATPGPAVQNKAAQDLSQDAFFKEVNAELADRGQSDDAGSNRGLSQVVEERLEAYFGAHAGALPAAGLYDRVLREVERPLIILTLRATRGNQVKAAEVLGLNRNTLRKKIRDLDIPVVRGQK